MLSPVSWRVEQHALAGHSVAPSPASLLVVTLNALGHVVVDHQTHVRLIDAHSERDGGYDDGKLVTDEAFLDIPSVIGLHAAVVRLSAEALPGQGPRGFLGRPSGETIDDCRLALVFPHQTQQRGEGFGLGFHGIG